MKRITSIRLTTSLAIILAVVAFLLINMAGGFLLNGRIDLTENKIFTLSDGTRRIVEKIEEPVRMRMYYSAALAQNIGQIQTYANRVRGLLEQYASESNGKILLELIDPEPFSPDEDQATAFGLNPLPVQNQQLFFGLAISDSVDNTEVIPFFSIERETFLEYDISRLLYDLVKPEKPVVGVINWLPPSQDGRQLIFLQQLSEQFRVETIETTVEELPTGLDTLLIIHPQDTISDNLAYAIDQYLLSNGKVIVFVDPVNENRSDGVTPPSSDMNQLFAGWGVQYTTSQVVADPSAALRVTMQTPTGAKSISHPTWLQLGDAAFSRDDPVTANLNQVRIISAGGLDVDPSKDSIDFASLIMTSNDNSGRINQTVILSPDPRSWSVGFRPVDTGIATAGRYSGVFNTAFPDRSGEGHLDSSVLASNLIVVADVDMLMDRYWVDVRNLLGQTITIRTADNGTFVLNAVDNMVGSSDLISLRSRGIKDRNFDVVADLRREAEARFQEQESQIQRELRDTESRINQLQKNKQDQNALIISDAQRSEIQKFQQKRVDTRKQLRDLQLQLNREIEHLGTWLKFLNIILIPILVLLLSFFLPTRLGRSRK